MQAIDERADLLALAERCVAATGPDRLLDVAIGGATGRPGMEGWEDVTRDYTSSLDAAMTLVPEGLWRRINVDPHGRANIRLGDTCAVTAATPALALTAAALRARATTPENDHAPHL